uniref:TSA: Wollemia nobilis Ref_Wollemi_Transcript_15592_1653 transcribed RNA sequence n=1 Tax=Wollemia nobilis TaxID=56998 RepID=A0A0C9S364_9CONI
MPALNVLGSARFGSGACRWRQKEEAPMPSCEVQSEEIYSRVNFQAMRPKRVTDPLNEVVRARLCGKSEVTKISNGYCSSGSEHEAEPASLADMVCGFMEEEEAVCSRCNCFSGIIEPFSESEPEEPNSTHMLESVVSCTTPVDMRLLGLVTHAVEMAMKFEKFAEQDVEVTESKCCVRRAVMNHLKTLGYNAGICKTRPDHLLEFPAGDYEYIDVIVERRNAKRDERIFVDIDFRAQFELARPTKEYSALLQLLPNIFVGKAETLHQIINIMCDAAKRSLKKKTMHLPPWRKYRYMQSKWLGSYRRTTNPVSNPHKARIAVEPSNEENCFTLTGPNFRQGEAMGIGQREWQPPSVNASKPVKNGKVSGLASALTLAGLTSPRS